MSAAATARRGWAPPARPDPIDVYRDDGPLARALGRLAGPALPLRAAAVLALAALPLLALAAFGGDDVSEPVAGAALAWAVLLAGATRGRPGRRTQRWMEPPLLRVIEFTAIIWLAALAGAEAYPAAFALLAALAFRHYDHVYRLRHRGETPASWVSLLSGGWEGRLIVLFALLLAGELRTGMFVAAVVLGVVFVAESAAGWLRGPQAGAPPAGEHEDDGEGAA
jgi:hypothetical protein